MFGDVGRSGDHDSDDEEFFKPTPPNNANSTLAKLFGFTPKVPRGSSERASVAAAPKSVKISDRYGPSNFRYIPAEPVENDKDEDTTNKPPVDWIIVRASVVTAYKLVDGDNAFLGKLGLALLNSSTGHRLLLYRTKTDVLGTVTLTPDTKLFLKQDYLQFRADDSNEFWSVLFEAESDRQALLTAIESRCCIEREPVVEEPLSEVEKDAPEPPKSKRSELAARMARMGGQAMPLPEKAKPPPIPTTAPGRGSDSSDTSDSKIETISTRPVRRPPFTSAAVGMQMVPLAGMIPTGNGGSVTGQGAGTMADVNFNLIMSENRMQNTEMRMNLTKLESKLDRVLDRIDLLHLHGGAGTERPTSVADKDAEVLELEEKLLELKRANHALKSKVRTLEATEREGTREANAKLEEQLKNLQELDERQKETIHSMQLQLEVTRTEVTQQKEKLAVIEKQLAEEKQTVEEKTKEMKFTVEQLEKTQRDQTLLKEQLEQENQRSEALRLQLEQLQKECDELKKAQPQWPTGSSASLVKDIMNGCYQQLCDQITDPQVLRIIAQTIKRETKAALEREVTQ